MSKTATAVVTKAEEKTIEYIPVGTDAKVTLTLRLIRDYIAVPTKSGVKPTLAECYNFGMMCKARGLNPHEGDCILQGYDTKDGAKFSIITTQVAFLKRAEVHPDHDGMESGVIVEEAGDVVEYPGEFVLPNQRLLGGWAKIHSKSKKHPVYVRLDVSKYIPKKFQFTLWETNPAMMIAKCSRVGGLRQAYPSKVSNLYIPAEMGHIEQEKEARILTAEAGGGVKLDIEPEEKTATESLAEKVQETSDVEIINELGDEFNRVEPGPPVKTAKDVPKAKTKKPAKVEPEDALWSMILQMSNGDEKQALRVLERYMKKAGRDTEGKKSYADLDLPDKNCIRPHVEEDFNAQSGIAEPRMSLGE